MSLSTWKKGLAVTAGLFAFCASSFALADDDCAPLKIDQRVKVDIVYDGGSFLARDAVIGLTGVHVPVYTRHLEPPQPLGKAVAQAVGELVQRSKGFLNLEFDRLNAYKGRVLAHVYLGDGRNLALSLLENGFALVDTQLPNQLHAQCYRRAEARAREAKLGLWQFQDQGVPVVEASQLTAAHKGFQIVRGKVSHVEQKEQFVSLILERASIRIPNDALALFDVQALFALKGKVVEIRDDFSFYKNYMMASLEHPGQIDVLADRFYEQLAKAPKASASIKP